MNHVDENQRTTTIAMAFMQDRKFESYKAIWDRLMQIGEEKNFVIKPKIYVSDGEMCLIKLGDLMSPEYSLACIFHFNKLQADDFQKVLSCRTNESASGLNTINLVWQTIKLLYMISYDKVRYLKTLYFPYAKDEFCFR